MYLQVKLQGHLLKQTDSNIRFYFYFIVVIRIANDV